MKIVGTMMVRDEVDIVAAMLEHHLAQGVDLIIVTDNASVDGTTEVLEAYAAAGVVELHHDPVHLKQQHSVVTTMARRARTEYGADWVLNMDADEFFVPVDKSRSLRELLTQIPLGFNAFTAEVVNMVGPPARLGSGVSRLRWRDHRAPESLWAVGIHAHPTPNAIHRGDPTVVVAQGNHFVSLTSNGKPSPELAIEVLHLPWRSWAQLERKVVNAGRAYTANPDLKPSKNHHGMADYGRYLAGRLWHSYVARGPRPDELDGESAEYVEDGWLADALGNLGPSARLPETLAACIEPALEDVLKRDEHAQDAAIGLQFHELERERDELRQRVDEYARQQGDLRKRIRRLEKRQARKAVAQP